MFTNLFFALTLISTGGLLYFKLVDFNLVLDILLKVIASLFFIVTAFSAYIDRRRGKRNNRYALIIIVGLCASLIGDLAMELNGMIENDAEVALFAGIGAFAAAQITYTCAFVYITGGKKLGELLRTLGITIGIAGGISLFIAFGGVMDTGEMSVPVYIYAVLISLMCAESLGLLRYRRNARFAAYCAIIGAWLFFLSDFILTFVLFMEVSEEVGNVLTAANLITYYTGQAFIALSLKKTLSEA